MRWIGQRRLQEHSELRESTESAGEDIIHQLTITLREEEMLGLAALVGVAKNDNAAPVDEESVARELLQQGLAAKLHEAGLPWPPGPGHTSRTAAGQTTASPAGTPAPAGGHGVVEPTASEPASEVTEPNTLLNLLRSVMANEKFRSGALVILAIAVAVVLVGGYGLRWQWTGFPGNSQLWDWLGLLLLPISFAVLPLWLKYSEHISPVRRATYFAAVAAFAVFVVVGYMAPLGWTGFSGNTLWDWITLLLLPATLITIQTWPQSGRPVKTWHWVAAAVILTVWLATIFGGYMGDWTWTGYQGNTLWDWLNLLLLPIVFPTILLPAATALISGNVERRVAEEKEKLEKLLREEKAAVEIGKAAAGSPVAAETRG